MNQDVIADRIAKFTVELEALVRTAAIDAVTAALGGATSAPSVALPRRGPGRPRTTTVSAPPKPTAPVPATGTPKLSFKRKKGGKRTPEQLAQIDAAALAFVKANPGKGVEHMAKTMGVASKDVASRVLLLIQGKKIGKTGQKRATKYFPV